MYESATVENEFSGDRLQGNSVTGIQTFVSNPNQSKTLKNEFSD
jgi:hypothetical protein